MVDLADDVIKGKILHKLTKAGKFEHSHTDIINLYKGFPGHLQGRAKTLVREMIRKGLLKLKPTSYGQHVSINLEQSDEILRLIEVFKNFRS